MRLRGVAVGVLVSCCLGGQATAQGASSPSTTARWLPNQADATWTYGWRDDPFSPATTYERYTVASRSASDVTLAWTTDDAGNAPGAAKSQGTIRYTYGNTGIFNADWSSTPPPPDFPVLCASASQCGNSLASAHYLLIWGSRQPLLLEPLVRGARWSSTGGMANDVASSSRYVGAERVVVPGFPRGVYAAKVVTDITQAGAIGDPYGSGQRTVWWVYGVGPVKIVFSHTGGGVSTAELHRTNLQPRPRPSDQALLPLRQGDVMRFEYRNSKHLRQASRQQFTVGAVSNGTARVDVRELSGPIATRGSYLFATGLSGVTLTQSQKDTATRATFPPLGPRGAGSSRRTFYTPFDLLTFGYNPVVPGAVKKGTTWRAPKGGQDRATYGVDGTSTVLGTQTVRTPAGRFKATLIESRLTQRGFRYGSGTRRTWLAPGIGLVKLEFRHRDGSVSTVRRIR